MARPGFVVFREVHLLPHWAVALLTRLNYRHWLALVVAGGVIVAVLLEREHRGLQAQINGKSDTAAVTRQFRSLEAKVDDVGASVDSIAERLRQVLCEQKPRWCR